jgi:hypothetical protein
VEDRIDDAVGACFRFAGSYSTLKRYVRTQIAPSRSTAMLLAA